jgi:TPR repeat protein
MAKIRPPIHEPFDLALPEFYGDGTRWTIYRRLVEIGVEIGDPLAQYAMATWYLHGQPKLGIKKNLRKAVVLLEACAPVFNRAAYDLAVCKLGGAGARRDPEVAFLLFSRSASLGSLAALEAQADCLASGIGTPKDLEAARLLRRRAARWKHQLDQLGALRPSNPRRSDGPASRRARRVRSRRDS